MDKYTRAQERISKGLWTVDAEAGVICGRRGPLGSTNSSGYLFLSMSRGVGLSNQNALAHRVVWESAHGPIPYGMQVNHINGIKTDNRLANLELVTAQENVRHAHRIGLAHGAPSGEHHPLARLTQEQVDDIRLRASRGERQTKIAASLGLSRQQISSIVNYKSWAA